ncbi:MAG: hypothetical protein R6V47_06485 [Candidatus Delongbacteria bacterium]
MEQKLVIYIAILIVLISCTPEIEDDYIDFTFSDLTEYRLYDLENSTAALVKVNYYAHLKRNGIDLRSDTSYTENAVFGKLPGYEWKYIGAFGTDSNFTAVKKGGDSLFFDSGNGVEFYMVDIGAEQADTLENIEYFSDLEFSLCDSITREELDKKNEYKKYRYWKDSIINLYR